MGHTNDFLDSVRRAIAPADTVLAEARARLALVRAIALGFPGALRTYDSGSVPAHTVNNPVTDADGGVVLNRVFYPQLGPEGRGETPTDVTTELCRLLGPEIRKTYPDARCGTSKRGPKITFRAAVEAQDPSVDLVVALTRREGNGLWIPNLAMDRWEASDPERHVMLLVGDAESLRRTRRRVIRLLKAWNKQWTDPAFSSFHLSVLAWEHVAPGMGIATALHAVLDQGARFLATGRNTPDPAKVSAPLKLMKNVSREAAVSRMRGAAEAMADALEHDDDQDVVQAALHRVFRAYIAPPPQDKLAGVVAALRRGGPISTATLGLPGHAVTVPSTRAYGGRRPR